MIDRGQRAVSTALGAICILILCILLTAGLWPFCAPKNAVRWIAGQNGVQFGRNAIVASAEGFHSSSPGGDCTLELLLEPADFKSASTFLAFDSSSDPTVPFAVQQRWEDVEIHRAGRDEGGSRVRLWLGTHNAFKFGHRTLVTITGGHDSTVLYVNGSRAKVSSDFGLSSDDLTGRLVLGSSTVRGSWTGRITGLALYDSALTPVEVEEHYQRWIQAESPVAEGERSPVALYLFNEGRGDTIHDLTGHGHNLVIPSRYFVLHPQFLASPIGAFEDRWSGWRSWSYWANVCLNIAGFVPMGFFFTCYFSLVRPLRRPRISVIAMGLAVSLTIEIGQYFLPTRDSGINDLITNTLGTAIGAVFCSPALMRRIAARITTTSGGPVPS